MEVCHVESAVFDDPNLVSCAGLGPVVAPATIAPTNAGTFRCAFTPALAGSVSCAATSCGSPHCSASATTGPSPAQDTKFGSSNTADSTWQTSIPRVPFCPVGCDYR